MSAPDTINALVVAHRVLGQPSRFRMTDAEVLAMAGCLVGLDQQIDDLEAGPTTNARLAAAVASFILHWDALADRGLAEASGTQIEAAKAAFNTLKTSFEQEFPHGQKG